MTETQERPPRGIECINCAHEMRMIEFTISEDICLRMRWRCERCFNELPEALARTDPRALVRMDIARAMIGTV